MGYSIDGKIETWESRWGGCEAIGPLADLKDLSALLWQNVILIGFIAYIWFKKAKSRTAHENILFFIFFRRLRLGMGHLAHLKLLGSNPIFIMLIKDN